MTTDPAIAKAISDAEIELEMERLMKNRPTYTEAVGGTNELVEEGRTRAVISTAAEITVWNVETGEPSTIIFDSLKARTKQRFPDDHPNPEFAGKRVYTMNKAEAPEPRRGNLACPLYAANPSEEAKRLGFGDKGCRKPPYFFSEYDVELHVEKNHKRFYEVRKRSIEERRRQEDLERNRQLTEALVALSATGGRQKKGAADGTG